MVKSTMVDFGSECVKLGFPKKLVKLYRILNIEICAMVETGKDLSSNFIVNKDLRQGDAIIPLLFDILLETAIWWSEVGIWGNHIWQL